MNLPKELQTIFSDAKEELFKRDWFGSDWTACSGHWDDPRYTDTVVLKLSKKNWSTVFPITLYDGAEIHYAAWIDEKSFSKKELIFGMHVFAYPMINSKKVRKKDFTDWFRSEHGDTVQSWNYHTISMGPQVPYAGRFKFDDLSEIQGFMVSDFSRFASLATSIDERLTQLKEAYQVVAHNSGGCAPSA